MATYAVNRELLNDGEITSPKFNKVEYPNSFSDVPMSVDIAADAIDQQVDLSALGTIARVEIDVPSSLVDYLTVKVNTSTQALPVGQKTIFCEDVENLYFSSSNSDTEIKISILVIYE